MLAALLTGSRRLTLKKVNQALPAGYELVKGEGVYYFYGPDTANWYSAQVEVYSLNQMTLEGWLEEFEGKRTDRRNP